MPEPHSSQAAVPLRMAVGLSGGGHRATLFGLGALMYLVDAGRHRDTVSIASVSGGSITNGFLAQTLDFQTASPAEFENRVVRPLASQIAQRGTLFAPLLSRLYLILLVLGFVAVWLPFWCVPGPTWVRLLAWALALLAWGWFLGLRARVCARAFRLTLFSPTGKPTPLGAIATTVSHVLCATELRTAEAVYFAGDFVYGFAFGHGKPGTLPLYRAVQASADFPGGFPPVRLPTATHEFQAPPGDPARGSRTLILSDGGVYDNMGDQWARGFADRIRRWPWLAAHHPAPTLQVVVNASARVPWTPYRRGWVPLVNEVAALLRVNNVMYVNTTNVRRQDIVASFNPRAPEKAGPLPGALIQIAQSPFGVADRFAEGDDPVAGRAQAVIGALGSDNRQTWAEIARQNAAVATTLSKLGTEVSARLLYQGYMVAMCNLHVIFGGDGNWPLLVPPDPGRFTSLVR